MKVSYCSKQKIYTIKLTNEEIGKIHDDLNLGDHYNTKHLLNKCDEAFCNTTDSHLDLALFEEI